MATGADGPRSTAPPVENGPGRWTSTEADWEGVKDAVVELYWEQDKSLPEVMEAMATGRNFHATEKQYKYRFDKWKLEKNVSQTKMPGISRIRKERRLHEQKETEFSLRGRPIPPEKIDRWEKRHNSAEDQAVSPNGSIAASTPSGITYRTPGSLVSTPSAQDPTSPGEPLSPQHAADGDSLYPLQRSLLPIPRSPSPPSASRSMSRGLASDFAQHHHDPHNQPRSVLPSTGVGRMPGYGYGDGYPRQDQQFYGYQQPPGPADGFAFRYSLCTGRRKALLIGINYFNQRGQLRGCINDVRNMSAYLVENSGYKREDMVILTDDQQNPMSQPTRQNILRAMHWLVKDARPNDSLFFHYSGHGGQTKDLDGDEADGYDEVIYPVDFRKNGYIVDDEMHRIMVQPLEAGVRLTAIVDSCHSGTALDLPYIYSTQGILKEPNLAKEAGQGLLGAVSAYSRGDLGGVANNIMGFFKKATSSEDAYARSMAVKTSPADVVLFSGSKDDQTSADATIAAQATGAMSWAFITSLKKNPQQSYVQLLRSMRDELQTRHNQKPQLSCSHPLDSNLLFVM